MIEPATVMAIDEFQRRSPRHDVKNQATEDRILEVLDVVTGFCPVEQTIWDD
jgi:hypothetical protein